MQRMDTPYLQAAEVLPSELRELALSADQAVMASAEEFRLRQGQRVSLLCGGQELTLGGEPISPEDLRTVLELASRASAHTVMAQVRSGFVTIQGGHRIGLCGEAITKEGQICGLRTLSSAAVRIARQIEGLGETLLEELFERGQLQSTLILAPPGAGKTTLLREVVRRLSDGEGVSAHRVGLADERREISAFWEGQAQFDVGKQTDIMVDCRKSDALEILLRGMNPQVIAADEITSEDDAQTMAWAAGCGVVLLATAHGESLDDLYRRPVYAEIMHMKLFKRVVILKNRSGLRTARVEVLP